MSTETRSVTVKVFRDNDGYPTCCKYIVDQQCQFLTTRKMGTVEVCGFTGLDLRRGWHGMGEKDYAMEWDENHRLRPGKGCPIWTAEELKA